MIQKLKCWFWGHRWGWTSIYRPPSNPERRILARETDYHERYGFTDIVRACSCCGAVRSTRITGKLNDRSVSNDEIAQLRKIAEL
jgi:hypothetical protein